MKLLFSFLLTLTALSGFSQSVDPGPAYKRFPTLPPLQLLLGDSTTKYTKDSIPKKMPVFIMLFSPDCSHCQHTAEEMIAHKDEFKDIQIILATMHTITQMNDFVKTYGINQLPHVTVGKDVNYILPGFYNVGYLPFMAFYNKKGELISAIEGGLPIPKVLAIFNENK